MKIPVEIRMAANPEDSALPRSMDGMARHEQKITPTTAVTVAQTPTLRYLALPFLFGNHPRRSPPRVVHVQRGTRPWTTAHPVCTVFLVGNGTRY